MNHLAWGRPFASIVCAAMLAAIISSCGAAPAPVDREIHRSRNDLPDETLRQYFADPPNEYRIIQYGNPTAKQLQDFKQYGIGGCMAFFYNQLREPSHPRYQDPAAIRPMLDTAKTNGFPVWLADDFGYPSGMAGGRVVAEHPEYEVRELLRLTVDGHGPGPAELKIPDGVERIVTASIDPVQNGILMPARGRIVSLTNPRQVQTVGLDGDWRLSVFALRIRDRDTQAQSTMAGFGHTGRYPDLMNSGAVKAFIEFIHERLAREIGDLPSRVEGFYSNEPNLMRLPWYRTPPSDIRPFATLPWNDELPKTFKRMHGHDLLPVLGALYEGEDQESRRIRMDFYQTVAELVTASYSRQIAAWCEAHRILSSGHCLLEEYLPMHVACYGDMMKFASAFHVPAFDIGIPNPDRINSAHYRHAKFFSGVAAWKERDEVIALPDPIVEGGGLRRLSPVIPLVRNVVNMVFLYGGSKITSYMPLHPDKAGNATGYAPEAFLELNEYVGRLSLLLRGARQETGVALYYPIAMFQADYKPSGQKWPAAAAAYEDRQQAWDRTEQSLLDGGIDYTILHPEALQEARIENGLLRSGRGAYRYLVMPQVDILPLAAWKQIQRFEAGGGLVLWVDKKPLMGAYANEDAAVKRAMEKVPVLRAEELPDHIARPYDARFRLAFDAGAPPVSIARFQRGTKCIYYLVNRSPEPALIGVRPEGAVGAEIYDPSTGRIAALSAPAKADILGLGSLLVVHPMETGSGGAK